MYFKGFTRKELNMKGIYITTIIIIFICMVMFPLFSMKQTVVPNVPDDTPSDAQEVVFRVLISDTQKVEEIKASDYLRGVVAAEMSAENNVEALKAQAVASYTFALRKKELRTAEKYDVTDSPASDQAYISDEKIKEKWGSNYDKYNKKLTEVIEAVKGKTIVYNGELILAVCHSISGGKTEDAENVWGERYEYLVPVESVGDMLNPNYLSTEVFTVDEFKEKLKALNIEPSGEPSAWIGESKCSESGMVLNIKICGIDVGGRDMRSAFGLRSSNFDVSFADDKFQFNVRGYGHCVGLSQSGAQFMAEQGSSYTEILTWYYKGCEIK